MYTHAQYTFIQGNINTYSRGDKNPRTRNTVEIAIFWERYTENDDTYGMDVYLAHDNDGKGRAFFHKASTYSD